MAKTSHASTPRADSLLRIILVTAALAPAALCQNPAQAPTHTAAPAAASAPATNQPAPKLESLLDQPATPASIQSRADSLTIHADNASLTQTLQKVAASTGMKLDGISGDQRVFGTFGPGNPRDVINALLTGTDYNVVMVGSLSNGAPRELLLSPKSTHTIDAPSAPEAPAAPSDDDATDAPPEDQPMAPQPMPSIERPNDGPPNSPRSPQQMFQQLQQMHNQQNGQQSNQPQQ